MTALARLLRASVAGLVVAGCASPATHLAIANGNNVRIVDVGTGQTIHDVTAFLEVMRLAYRPDGERLAVGVCHQNRVVELDTSGYTEVGVPLTAASCPWDVGYAPDTQSLAAAVPFRPDPLGALFGHLRIVGPQPLDRDMGRPLPAVAYRPDGGQIAVATPQGLVVLGPGPGYQPIPGVPAVPAISLAYTTDGGRLIVGTPAGFGVLDAAAGFTQVLSDTGGAVHAIAVAPSGGWVALVRASQLSIRRSADFAEVATVSSAVGWRDADFSRDGTSLAAAELQDRVRVFGAPAWQQVQALQVAGRIDAVAFRPTGFGQHIPVVFIHGHSGGTDEAWFAPGGGTSFAAALAANPQLPVDAFYLDLPVHGGSPPQSVLDRSIADDALDLLALVEGGLDSRGAMQAGILNMPAYQTAGKVAIVAYSQGTISARYYLKNLMGTRRSNAITVSEFVAISPPNHGVADPVLVCTDTSEPDRARRQLCAGRVATAASASPLAVCGCGPLSTPDVMTSDQTGDDTFIPDLNGHPLADTCQAEPAHASEAPRSRPGTPGGVLYASLYADDEADFVGGHDQEGDCLGRRLARNLAPNADNREITGIPGGVIGALVHANTPHHWETICMALRTVVDHQVPASQIVACTGLTQPP